MCSFVGPLHGAVPSDGLPSRCQSFNPFGDSLTPNGSDKIYMDGFSGREISSQDRYESDEKRRPEEDVDGLPETSCGSGVLVVRLACLSRPAR